MAPLSETFFITGLGRSGTKLLATILNRSASYRVVHEWHWPLPGLQDRWFKIGRLTRFPIYRFVLARWPFPRLRRGYGEVNSLLRFTLHAHAAGWERYVLRRGIILREPRDIIASAMNRGQRSWDDFPAVCDEVLDMYFRLKALAEHSSLDYRIFQFEKMIADPAYLQQIVDWTGINDVTVTREDLKAKVNVNVKQWFPQHADWDSATTDIYRASERKLLARDDPVAAQTHG